MKFNSYNLKILVISSMLVLAACSPGSSGVTQEPITQEPVDIVEATAAAPAQESADSGGVPDGGAIDACSLITQAEAEATLGQPTGPGQPDDAPPIYSCSYQTTDFDVVSVVVLIYDDASQALGGYQMAIDINGYPEISGIGDRAYNAQPIFDINVLSGNIEVSVDISDASDDATQLQNSIELARLALSRLP